MDMVRVTVRVNKSGLGLVLVGDGHVDRHHSSSSTSRPSDDEIVYTDPLLSVVILEVVHGIGVPGSSETEQVKRHESILGHDDEVREEPCRRLNHTDLTVRHAYQPVMHRDKINTQIQRQTERQKLQRHESATAQSQQPPRKTLFFHLLFSLFVFFYLFCNTVCLFVCGLGVLSECI